MGVCLVIMSSYPRGFARSHAAHSCAVCTPPRAPHFNRGFYTMLPLEETILELLRIRGPCGLDDVVTYLPNRSWGRCSEFLIGCRGTDGWCFANSGTRLIRSHSTRRLRNPVQPLATWGRPLGTR